MDTLRDLQTKWERASRWYNLAVVPLNCSSFVGWDNTADEETLSAVSPRVARGFSDGNSIASLVVRSRSWIDLRR